MTAGEYLRRRREAAGLSRADVAARFQTEPRWSELERADWLARIEEDSEPVTLRVAALLIDLFPIDAAMLAELSTASAPRRRLTFDVPPAIAAACIAALPARQPVNVIDLATARARTPRRTAQVIDLAAMRADKPEGPAA